jgi:hypothetical protein
MLTQIPADRTLLPWTSGLGSEVTSMCSEKSVSTRRRMGTRMLVYVAS